MFKNFLFDLDGTLLDLDIESFLTQYFSLLGQEFSWMPPIKLKERIMMATEAMVKNDGKKTNQEVFHRAFFDGSTFREEELEPGFTHFYQHTFPLLMKTAKAKPFIREILTLLFGKGKKVVIATNPIFPQRAIRERLAWAGIGDLPFTLITSYENMHYCKPNLDYYREILDKIKGKAQETLMVGNDLGEDMVAGELGITTFLLEEHLIGEGETSYDKRGSLEDLYTYMHRILS